MHKYYEQFTKEERKKMAESLLEEHVINTIVDSNRNVVKISKDLGVDEVDLIKYRDKVIKSKFGIRE